LKTSYLQEVAYFRELRSEIQEIFSFNPSVTAAVDEYASNMMP
jgi:hypothetical protein